MVRAGGEEAEPAGNRADLRPILALLGRRHALELLHVLHRGGRLRFTELQRGLKISPKSLQSLLTGFVRAGLITRVVLPGEPRRSGYGLTAPGHGLHEIVEGVHQPARLSLRVPPAVRWSIEPALPAWGTDTSPGRSESFPTR